MRIINLTQHQATPEQKDSGVEDVPEGEDRKILFQALNFEDIPQVENIRERAAIVASLAKKFGAEGAMIGGAPYLMSSLEEQLKQVGIVPLYAFSKRESVEKVQADGSVQKVAVFRHTGFVQV